MKLAIRLLSIWLCLFWATHSFCFAEGSKELEGLGGTTKIIVGGTSNGANMAAFDGPDNNKLKFRIKDFNTEAVYLGFGEVTQGTSGTGSPIPLYYRIKDQAGNIVAGPTIVPEQGQGYISSIQEAEGPQPIVAAGYQPLTFNPASIGEFNIEFSRISNRPSGQATLKFFDLTVYRKAQQIALPGRVFSKQWSLNTLSFSNPSMAQFFVYTTDSIVSKIDLNGMQPLVFEVSCNKFGISNTGDVRLDRRSAFGQALNPEYTVFLNDPDPSIFPTGRPDATLIYKTDLKGCPSTGYCLELSVNREVEAEVWFELNGQSGFQENSADKLLERRLNIGYNCLNWDGLNGLGLPIAEGTRIDINISLITGMTHFPIFDAENNNNGFLITRIRPMGQSPRIYWDDRIFANGSAMLQGCLGNCRRWSNTYGDNRTLNTWWYGERVSTLKRFKFTRNCAPIANDDVFGFAYSDSLELDVAANDVDNNLNAASIRVLGTVQGGTAILRQGKLLFRPNGSFNCETIFKYAISDFGPTELDSTAVFSDTATVVLRISPPQPIVNSATFSVCQGSGNYIPQASSSNANLQIQWADSNGANLSFTAPQIATNASAVFKVMVRQFNPAKTNCIGEFKTLTIIVTPKPDASFSGLDTIYCQGASAVSLIPTDSRAVFSGTGISGNSFIPNTPGLHIISSIVNANGCVDTLQKHVRVYPKPDARFAALPDTPCAITGFIKLLPNAAGGKFSGIGVKNDTLFTSGLQGRVKVKYLLAANICSDSSFREVFIKPVLNANFSGLRDTLYCVSNTLRDTLKPLQFGGVFTGDGVTNGIFRPLSLGVKSITYSIGSGQCSESKTLRVRVVGSPNAALRNLPDTICQSTDSLRMNPVQMGGIYGGGLSSKGALSLSSLGTFKITYRLTLGDCLDSTVRYVTIVPAPNASFSGYKLNYCLNEAPSQLIPQAAGGVFKGIGIVGNSFVPNSLGLRNIRYVMRNSGCSDSVSVLITVGNKPPRPEIQLLGLDSLRCKTAAQMYQWYFNGVPIANAVTQSYRAKQNGRYSVQVLDLGCPSDTSLSVILGLVAAKQYIVNNFGINFFPNPASDQISFYHTGEQELKLQWYDAMGKQVFENVAPSGESLLNISHLAKGWYYLRSAEHPKLKLPPVFISR